MAINPSSPDQSTRVSPSSGGTLQIQMPDGDVQQVPILKPALTVGRAPDNDLVLDHPTVSRHHARLTLEQGKLYIEDLGSSNGTYIGDQQLSAGQRMEVPGNQAFEFGQVRLGFHSFGLPVSTSAPPGNPGLQAALTSFFNRFSPKRRLFMLAGGAVGSWLS